MLSDIAEDRVHCAERHADLAETRFRQRLSDLAPPSTPHATVLT